MYRKYKRAKQTRTRMHEHSVWIYTNVQIAISSMRLPGVRLMCCIKWSSLPGMSGWNVKRWSVKRGCVRSKEDASHNCHTCMNVNVANLCRCSYDTFDKVDPIISITGCLHITVLVGLFLSIYKWSIHLESTPISITYVQFIRKLLMQLDFPIFIENWGYAMLRHGWNEA